jgi:hypothetical protein
MAYAASCCATPRGADGWSVHGRGDLSRRRQDERADRSHGAKKVGAFVKANEKGLASLSKFNDMVSSGLKRAAVMATGAALATAAIVREIVQTGAEFDKTLVAAAAKFDPAIKRGTAGFEQLRQAAEDIGEKPSLTRYRARRRSKR